MHKLTTRIIFICLITFLVAIPSRAGYIDECLTKVLPMDDGSFIGAVQCNTLDFFVYIDKDGKPNKRNFVLQPWIDMFHLVDYIPDERMYCIYQPDSSRPLYRGMVLDFEWNILSETGLEGMYQIISANGCWWGIAAGPVIREVSFDGYETINHKLPEIKGVNYYEDLVSFTIDLDDNIIMLFNKCDKEGFAGDGIIRKIKNGKLLAQWVVDVPRVPETQLEIGWVGPVADEHGNILVAHYESPCSSQCMDRVRVHKFGPGGGHIWTWGENLLILSDIRITLDGTIMLLRPGGPIYKLTPDGKFIEQIVIQGITDLNVPECGKSK